MNKPKGRVIMKKTLFFFVVFSFIVCFIGNVIADEFTLHSGVSFSMTKEEVLQKEKDAGFTAELEKADKNYSANCSAKHDSEQIDVTGQIAGCPGSTIIYHFDRKNGKLDAATYYLQASTSQKDRYKAVRESLVNKYGEPETDGMATVFHQKLPMDAYSFIDNYVNSYNMETLNWSCSIDYLQNDVWVIPQEDNTSIVITGINGILNLKIDQKTTFYMVIVGYQKYNNNEIENVLSSLKEEIDTYQNQLQNDL